MPVLSDVPAAPSPEAVQRALSRGKRDRGWFRGEIDAAIQAALPLLRPRIAFEWADVLGVEGETVRVRFDSGFETGPETGPDTGSNIGTDTGPETRLTVGPNVHLLRPARRALAFVSTAGQPLSDAVQARNDAGDFLGGYLLDCVGVAALSTVSESANALAESAARERNWGVGARLGPGSLVGWDTARQREFCDFLPLAEAGIALAESGLLHPFKSASGLVPIGPDYPETTAGSVCGLCRLADTCWRRR
jgi:hypothetical protein